MVRATATGSPRLPVGRVVAASYAAGISLVGYNLGVRRQTSRDVLQRWRDEAEPRSYPAATTAVFAVGANDTAEEDGVLRVEASDSVQALAVLLQQAEEAGLPAMAVGPAPVGDRSQTERIVALSGRFARALHSARGAVCERGGGALPKRDVED